MNLFGTKTSTNSSDISANTIPASFYELSGRSMSGEQVSFEEFRGKVVLAVNTASKCGFTGQYDGLEELYKEYKDRGLVILGFPSNDFLSQEPGSNEEIARFCKLNFGVSFPLFEKGAVTGSDMQPVYRFLTAQEKIGFPKSILWNFEKFLIDRNGRVVTRFRSTAKPRGGALEKAVTGLLNESAPSA